jgi:transcription-repair coupling factor (superfamily II helicase)
VSASTCTCGWSERPEEDEVDVKIDLPIDAHLPLEYIGAERLRLEIYRKIASARDAAALDEVVAEMRDRYGEPPTPVANLVAVARFRFLARAYGLSEVSLQGKHIRLGPLALADSKQLRLKRLYPEAVYKVVANTISLPRPMTRRVGGEPVRDTALLGWAAELLATVLGDPPGDSVRTP